MLRQIEATHEISLKTSDASFTLPYQVFKLRPPAMVDIRVHGESVLKVRRDKSVVLNLNLKPTKASASKEAHIVFTHNIL